MKGRSREPSGVVNAAHTFQKYLLEPQLFQVRGTSSIHRTREPNRNVDFQAAPRSSGQKQHISSQANHVQRKVWKVLQ